MTVDARAWFYSSPDSQAHVITAQVNRTLWAERVNGAYLRCVRAEAPFRAEGWWKGKRIAVEWEPGRWLTLRCEGEAPAVAEALRYALKFAPTLRYEDSDGWVVTEWHADPKAREARWQAVQGHPAYKNPRRLDV